MAKILSKYFLAIVPTGEVQEKVTALKLELKETFNLKYALRSPAHITLKMPFQWNEAKEERLTTKLASFFQSQPEFSLKLRGIGKFGRRVIFIQVREQPLLRELQGGLVEMCKTKLNLKKELSDEAYHPHMTLAFKDMKERLFESYWDFLRGFDLSYSMEVKEVALLKKNGVKWEVSKKFLLGKNQKDFKNNI